MSLRTLHALSPTCRDAARLISETAERDLTRVERTGLVIHLAICRSCRNYRHCVRFLSLALSAAAGRDVTGESLPALARERIRQTLTGEKM